MKTDFISRLVAATVIVLQASSPLHAQQNDYGGYNIAGDASIAESPYGEARGWPVFSARVSGNFAFCFAEAEPAPGNFVRLGWDGMQWQLAVPLTMRPDWEGTLQIDGKGSGQGYGRGADYVSGTSVPGWTFAWLGEAELDGLRNGSTAILGVGKFDLDFPLAGSAAAILKVQECVNRAGTPGSAANQPASEAMPQTGSLFRNVMHDCYLSTNDNGEISCDMVAGAGSRWELSPEDEGKYTSLYNLKYSCALAMGRGKDDSDQVACYFNGDEQKAAYKFDFRPVGDVFNLFNARRKCGIYGNPTDIVTCLQLEGSMDQQWVAVN